MGRETLNHLFLLAKPAGTNTGVTIVIRMLSLWIGLDSLGQHLLSPAKNEGTIHNAGECRVVLDS